MEIKPRFKNSFGVTGTETEIDLLKKHAISAGYNFKNTGYNRGLLWLEGYTKMLWNPVSLSHPICLSTPEGWQRALSLAEEKEEEVPEYVKFICTYEKLTTGKIYKFNRWGEGKMYMWIENDIGEDVGYATSQFELSTKEAYERQELLEKTPTKEEIERVLNYLKEITK